MSAAGAPSRPVDHIVLRVLGPLCALALLSCSDRRGATMLPDPDRPFALPALQSAVPQYELWIPEATLALFAADVDTPAQPAVFVYDGRRYDALVRLRGNSSRYWPKRSWRVELLDDELQDRNKLNLISEWKDETLMVEKLGYDFLAGMHAPAPVATYVRLTINGRYEGVYLDTERVDKDFLDAHRFIDDDASIYRCGRKDCEMKPWRAEFQTDWEKETNELEGREELHQILEAITFTPEPDLAAVLDERLELELYLRTMVLDTLISMEITEDSRSYFIHDRESDRWTYVPWDLNNADLRWTPGSSVGGSADVTRPLFGFSLADRWVTEKYWYRTERYPDVAWHPISSNLNTRIAMNAALRARLVALLERALDEIFHPDVLRPRVEAIHALLRPHVVDDPYVSIAKFDDSPRYLEEYNLGRIEFVRSEIARLTATPALAISMLDPQRQRVALKNLGTDPIDLQPLALVTNVRARPFLPNLPAHSLRPGESIELDAKALGLELASRGEVGLFDPAQAAPYDVLFYGEIPVATVYARSDAAPERWELRRRP